LDAQANIAFLSKLLYLRAEGLLLFDDQAVNRFKTGNVNYLLGWSSDKLLLDQAGVAGAVFPSIPSWAPTAKHY
jgi:hypothetical protein